jgi:hypothetical protein
MGLDRTTDMRETSQINSEGAPMSRRSGKFSVLITATAVIELWVGSMVGSVAFAQDTNVPRSHEQSSDPRYDAPIGARQPRQQDLPPDVLRDEGKVTPSHSEFDKHLQICQPC